MSEFERFVYVALSGSDGAALKVIPGSTVGITAAFTRRLGIFARLAGVYILPVDYIKKGLRGKSSMQSWLHAMRPERSCKDRQLIENPKLCIQIVD